MPVAGTDLTEFALNGRRILRHRGRLTLEDGTLAGADIDFPGAIRVLVREVGLTVPEALRMATVAPAAALGASDRLGRLAPGLPADLVHLDADLALRGIWRAGRPVEGANHRPVSS
jgi:N-acetylglucosamine-6-phosphate deacetylase